MALERLVRSEPFRLFFCQDARSKDKKPTLLTGEANLEAEMRQKQTLSMKIINNT
jgi:hypothetical protein